MSTLWEMYSCEEMVTSLCTFKIPYDTINTESIEIISTHNNQSKYHTKSEVDLNDLRYQ